MFVESRFALASLRATAFSLLLTGSPIELAPRRHMQHDVKCLTKLHT